MNQLLGSYILLTHPSILCPIPYKIDKEIRVNDIKIIYKIKTSFPLLSPTPRGAGMRCKLGDGW